MAKKKVGELQNHLQKTLNLLNKKNPALANQIEFFGNEMCGQLLQSWTVIAELRLENR